MVTLKRSPWTLGINRSEDTKLILLTKGFVSLIDMANKDLAEFNWSASKIGNTVYAIRKDPANGKRILLNRAIMERILRRPLSDDEQVDHRSGQGLVPIPEKSNAFLFRQSCISYRHFRSI